MEKEEKIALEKRAVKDFSKRIKEFTYDLDNSAGIFETRVKYQVGETIIQVLGSHKESFAILKAHEVFYGENIKLELGKKVNVTFKKSLKAMIKKHNRRKLDAI